MLNQDDKDNLAGKVKEINQGLKSGFMQRLSLKNGPLGKLPPVKPAKTEMGLLHGELNLLVKNLGIEEEDVISAKG